MSVNKNILINFNLYDKFISTFKEEDIKLLLSLKMMYSIHMENNKDKLGFKEYAKQGFRFLLKFMAIPFFKIFILDSNKVAIIKNSSIEEEISKMYEFSLVDFQWKLNFNNKFLLIYKRLFKSIYQLYKSSELNKKYIFMLAHRLIDYLMVYHTIDINNIKILLVENDRHPQNLALVHLFKDKELRTIKYDNWLIDSINHNDIYCEEYFYPSLYHKRIIESFDSNKELIYHKGGFLNWDKLKKYSYIPKKNSVVVIYFTQFGIDKKEYLQYIHDIDKILAKLYSKYVLRIKVHPRENIDKYKIELEQNKKISIIDNTVNNYELISQANFCFSVFSTISLEAKHIMENSYFINYNYQNFDIVDYNSIGLDLIDGIDTLETVLNKKNIPISKDNFIEKNNCSYPYSSKNLFELVSNDK